MSARVVVLCLSIFCSWALVACVTNHLETVSSWGPQMGPVGTTVTIIGTNLGGATGDVEINGVKVKNLSGDEMSIQFDIPPGATSGNITIDGFNVGRFTVTS
jgi:hypothetical protein